jgi:O-methyltransferase
LNRTADSSAKDFLTRATLPEEHVVLSNQIYVLKSHGVEGDVAEFGCFKGFSTSVLSHACRANGVKLHVFDSFGGLPASSSGYYTAGEFKGTFDEVLKNVTTFGDPSVCEFHKGFFSESLPKRASSPLCLVWADVDLEVSAEDMIGVFTDLSPRGSLISNEAQPYAYRDGRIVEAKSPDAVLPVFREALAQRGVVRGDHLAAVTGSVYVEGQGTPVLPWSLLEPLVERARRQ